MKIGKEFSDHRGYYRTIFFVPEFLIPLFEPIYWSLLKVRELSYIWFGQRDNDAGNSLAMPKIRCEFPEHYDNGYKYKIKGKNDRKNLL